MASTLLHSLCLPLQDKKEEWRRKVVMLDKEHTKQFKKSRKNLKKKSDYLEKAEKTLKKSKNNQELVNNFPLNTHLQDEERLVSHNLID